MCFRTKTRKKKYKIFCETYNRGRRYLEAFPKDNATRPRSESNDVDQVWFLEKVENNSKYYRIGCVTRNRGERYLEAFPTYNKVGLSEKDICQQDQVWTLEPLDDEYFRIVCLTKNGGQRYLEAFPKDDFCRPNHERREKFFSDQKWKFQMI